MTLSILIVNWNTRDQLRACLQSIYEFPGSEPFETIVVDNQSSDGSSEAVRSEFPQVKLVEAGSNSGYARGNNLALSEAEGSFLLTLNPDTELQPGVIDTALSALRADPQAGCLGARLYGVNGETQPSIRGFPSVLGIFGDLTGLAKLLPGSIFDSYRQNAFDYDSPGPAEQPMGTFLLFRREALESVGPIQSAFDENFPIFFNEVDLLYRLKLAGWHCLYDPRVAILHLGGASTRQVRKPMIWESHNSLIRYFRKHWLRWWNFPVFALLAVFVWFGALIRARGFHVGFRP